MPVGSTVYSRYRTPPRLNVPIPKVSEGLRHGPAEAGGDEGGEDARQNVEEDPEQCEPHEGHHDIDPNGDNAARQAVIHNIVRA